MAAGAGALNAFADAFAGEVVRPGDATYDAARVVWNGAVDRRPALVVRPAGRDDVVAAVRFAREHELDLAVRSGGHSIPGLSTCDDGVVVDLSRMRGVRVDAQRRTASVAGGSLLGELDRAAQAAGLVCPVGVVSHTGVAGLTLGGGMGRLQRTLGLTVDSLRAVELVTADGRVVRASNDEHADLFWGVRGAGANLGIATAFELALHPFDGVVTWGRVVHPAERARELAALFRAAAETAPRELWLSFAVGLALPAESFPPELAGRPIAGVAAHHCGTPEAAERDLAELRRFGPPVIDTMGVARYLDVQGASDEAMRWGHRFSMRSAFLGSLPDEAVDAAVEHLARLPAGADGGFSVWSCGGAIADVPEEATAFSGRAAAYWASAEVLWDDASLDDACRSWGRAALDPLQPFASRGRYVNDVAETGPDLARTIYGEAKYERLVALKREWDPDNVFRLNQNIRP